MALSLVGRLSFRTSVLSSRTYCSAPAAAAAAAAPRSIPEMAAALKSLTSRVDRGEAPAEELDVFASELIATSQRVMAESPLLGNKSIADLVSNPKPVEMADIIAKYGDIEVKEGETLAQALTHLQSVISSAENQDFLAPLLQAGHVSLGSNYNPLNPPKIDFDRWRELLTNTDAVDEMEKHYKMFEETVMPSLDLTNEFKQMDKLYEQEFTELRARAQAAKASIEACIEQVKISQIETANLHNELVQDYLDQDPELERSLELNLVAGRWDPEEDGVSAEAHVSKPNKTDMFWDAQIEATKAESERAPSANPTLEEDLNKSIGL